MEQKKRGKVLLPSAMMAVVGMLMGAAVGPAPLTGSILGAERGPTVNWEFFDLEGLEAGLALAASEATSCPRDYEPKNRLGGQHADCSFVCPPPAGTVTVQVDADDEDANVDGTGSCGVHDAHCSDRDYCSATVGYSTEADGRCSGEADEAWNSGFYLNCYANAEDAGDPQPSDWCVVEKPINVCIDRTTRTSAYPHIGVFSILCAHVTCKVDVADGTLVVSLEDGQPGIYIGGFAGKAVGAVCDETGACHLVVPRITQNAGRTSFVV